MYVVLAAVVFLLILVWKLGPWFQSLYCVDLACTCNSQKKQTQSLDCVYWKLYLLEVMLCDLKKLAQIVIWGGHGGSIYFNILHSRGQGVSVFKCRETVFPITSSPLVYSVVFLIQHIGVLDQKKRHIRRKSL